jgi:AhpD family alkylhydroperoxidase
MENRININETEPKAYKAMYDLEGFLSASELKKTHKNLIKIRASQINHCAYCIDMHTKEALESGENIQRIFLIDAWRETNVFTEEEKALLELTEEVTLIHEKGVSDATYKKAMQYFDPHYIAVIIMAVVAINGWNRIAVSTNMGFSIKLSSSISSISI